MINKEEALQFIDELESALSRFSIVDENACNTTSSETYKELQEYHFDLQNKLFQIQTFIEELK